MMKKLFPAILLTIFLCSCNQDEACQNRIQAKILEVYNTPIRPGYEGRNPYWNKFAKKFMYAPAFDFKTVDGAKSYRYTVTEVLEDTSARCWSFTGGTPSVHPACITSLYKH